MDCSVTSSTQTMTRRARVPLYQAKTLPRKDSLHLRIIPGPRIKHAGEVRQSGYTPTEEGVVTVPRCYYNATAGERPSISSTSGMDIWLNKCGA